MEKIASATLYQPQDEQSYEEEQPANVAPTGGFHSADVDWRDRGCVTRIKNQHNTPVCWVFSAVAAVESHNKITNGELIELSEQQLVDCIPDGNRRGCPKNAFQHIIVNNDRGKKIQKESCKLKEKEIVCRVEKLEAIPREDETELEKAVRDKGPVVACLAINDKRKFTFLTECEIFEDTHVDEQGDPLQHAVLIVGYGRGPGNRKYWLIKNSWGVDDPNNPTSGFLKIIKDQENNCDVAECAMYPIVTRKTTSGSESQQPA